MHEPTRPESQPTPTWRRLLRPLHPRRVGARLLHVAHLLGWHHARLWLSGLAPSRLAASWRWLRDHRRVVATRRAEPRLTVAVDIAPFWEPLTGIGWYLYRLLQHLAHRDDLRLRLYGPDLVDKGDQPPPVVELPAGPAIEIVRVRIPEDFSIVHYWLADRLRERQNRLVDADRNDVLFAPNFLPPPRFTGCRGALVATVHDLSVEVVPETMRESTRRQLAAGLRATLGRAARVLTDCDAVRDEILAAGLAPPERVRTVHLAPATGRLEERAAEKETPEPERERPYALHVGTLEPRKNLPFLLDAFERFVASWDGPGTAPELVLVGGRGWKSEAIVARIDEAVQAGWLRHEGYADDARLASLYAGARWLVLASLYEGFGLPAVEAMVHGVPQLLADLPVLREVGGDAALYAPNDDVGAWTDLLHRAFTDDALRAELGARAAERAALFDWQKTAEETVAVWHDAVGRPFQAGSTEAESAR